MRIGKKTIRMLVAGLVLIFGFWWLVHFLTIGKLIITSDNSNNSISLSKIGDTKFSKSGAKSITLKLQSGRYIATVKRNSLATAQVINLKAHRSVKYDLSPGNSRGVEPVIDRAAHNLTADDSRLVYVDSLAETLGQVDKQNQLSIVSVGHNFRSIKWVDTSYGIGQDDARHLYLIDNQAISLLTLPKAYDQNISISYAITADKKIYVSMGRDVYSRGANGDYKKIFSADSPFLALSAQAASLLVIDYPHGSSAGKSSVPRVSVITNETKPITKNLEFTNAAWSKSGKYFVANTVVWDSLFKEKTVLPSPNISSFSWLDDNTLFYSLSDQLWSYSLETQRADLIANMPLGKTIIEMTTDKAASYVYLVIGQISSNKFEVKRVGLKGQVPPSYIYQLQTILPKDFGQYSLSLVNFASPPAIYINSQSDSPAQVYESAARVELQQDGFDLSKLQLRFAN